MPAKILQEVHHIYVINVGATKTEDGEDRLYAMSFSGTNFGPCVALYSPGESVSSINRR